MDLSIGPGRPTPRTSFRIGNYGKVPAIVHRVGAHFAMIELPVTKETLDAPNLGAGTAIAEVWYPSVILTQGKIYSLPPFDVPLGMPNVEFEFVNKAVYLKYVAQHGLFLSITVQYEDAVSGLMRVGHTLWRFDPGGFARYGGKNFNYERLVS